MLLVNGMHSPTSHGGCRRHDAGAPVRPPHARLDGPGGPTGAAQDGQTDAQGAEGYA